MPNWNKIKAEYIAGTSYRKLADKYGVSSNTILCRLRRENWTDLRKQKQSKYNAEIVDKVVQKEIKQATTIEAVADMLLKKIQEGVESGTLIVDSQSIRQITASIKDLKDIKGIKSDIDMREQEARIEKLRKDCQTEDTNNEIRVVLSKEVEDYSE